jgi:phage gp46-like protein
MKTFDVAIVETLNGGDVQLNGNDLAVINGIENMIYLALFGGNVEASTQTRFVQVQSFDYWANALFMKNTPSQQFNSETERALNNTPLTSSGRVLIENAIKKDLDFFKNVGATVDITVLIVATDKITINIKVTIPQEQTTLTIINLRKTTDGDFFILDFDTDFFT